MDKRWRNESSPVDEQRREFMRQTALLFGGVLTASTFPLLTSCVSNRQGPNSSSTIYAPTHIELNIQVPVGKGAGIDPLYELGLEVAQKLGKRFFDPGEVVQQDIQGVPTRSVDPNNQHTGFRSVQLQNDLVTPIMMHERLSPQSRFVQLGQANPKRNFSLISGHKQKAFWIHRRWLHWLINDDSCNLSVAGDTHFGPCGIKGCPVWVCKQKLVMMDGTPKELTMLADREQYDLAILDEHQRHAPKWKGCEVVNPEVGECHDTGEF